MFLLLRCLRPIRLGALGGCGAEWRVRARLGGLAALAALVAAEILRRRVRMRRLPESSRSAVRRGEGLSTLSGNGGDERWYGSC